MKSAQTIRQTNEDAARIKKEHPGRFLFCAALPLPDVQKAIEEAKYALDVLKADGTRMKDYLLKEPDLAPFREMILMENASKLWNLSSKTDNNIFNRNMKQPTFESLNSPWPKGEPNTGYAQYFIGNSYLAPAPSSLSLLR